MRGSRKRKRQQFLEMMSREAVECYRVPYRDWDPGEKELLPQFLSLTGGDKRILDLAGGYAKAAPSLLQDGNSVVLADMSLPSLQAGRNELTHGDVQFVRLNMLAGMPFVEGAFDGIWFAEAFEYVPPDERMEFLKDLRRILKEHGVVFLNMEGLSDELPMRSYLRNYLYWKLVKRAPVVWGEYIYMLDLPGYKGWHYHSLVLGKRIERLLRTAGFEILKSKPSGESEYSAYLMRAV